MVVNRIVQNKNPEEAMSFLLSQYPNQIQSARSIYSMWSRVRKIMLDEELVANPSYHSEIARIGKLVSSQEDLDRIIRLLSSSLTDQHRVSISSRPFLDDQDLDDELKACDPCNDLFHRFQLPEHIIKAKFSQELQRTRLNQQHALRPREDYKLSEEELFDMFSKVDDRLTFSESIITSKQYYDVIVCLQLASGRRNFEIISTLEYRPGPTSYQAIVSGICKNQNLEMHENIIPEYTIPLNVDYKTFSKAMNAVRTYKPLYEMTPSEVNSSYGARILAASERLFGRRLTHTQKRNIYVEKAYRMRNVNQFCSGAQSCSRHMWAAKALCHTTSISTDCTQRYQAMTVE